MLPMSLTYYNPTASSTRDGGILDEENNLFYEFQNGGLNLESGTTWSVVASVGARYKLTVMSDLLVDLRWQYYFTNWTDGLNHDNIQDKANDWLIWLNVGYIYYLD